MTAIADDVASGVAPRAARLLSGDGGEEPGIEMMGGSRLRDLRAEPDVHSFSCVEVPRGIADARCLATGGRVDKGYT
ncbi:MAG: hypothetical protein NVS2B8_05160 [Vulcanimicrobiaceae bacterium]